MFSSNHRAGSHHSSGYGAHPPFYFAPHGTQPPYMPRSLPPRSPSDPSLPPQPGVCPDPSQYMYHPVHPLPSHYHPPQLSQGQNADGVEGNGNLDLGVGATTMKEESSCSDDELTGTANNVCNKNMLGHLPNNIHPEEVKGCHESQVTPRLFNNRAPHSRHMAGYSHCLGYPASQYCLPPPPSYSNPQSGICPPPEIWNVPHPFASHVDTNNPYQLPSLYPHVANSCPLPSGIDHSVPRRNDCRKEMKRKWISSIHSKPFCPAPSKEPNKKEVLNCGRNTQSVSATSKTTRRRKKMYSDFVGVTYNKTHAKYQACITHYRKQHYLGRYKLAVDAALAYDESARLLKGSSWKVNFQTRHEYEAAKFRELESFGKMGGSSVDVAGSLAAVALKVEEIASNVGQSGVGGKFLGSSHVDFHRSREYERRLTENPEDGVEGKSRDDELASATTTQSMPKVTPSPTLQISTRTRKQESPPPNFADVHPSLDTPLSISPNAIRHTMGIDSRTPDSVIRPTFLTYKVVQESHLSSTVLEQAPCPLPDCTPVIEKRAIQPVSKKAGHSVPAALGMHGTPSVSLESEGGVQIGLSSTSPKGAPPVIQNGTLAAASALMTLFGNEKNVQD